MNHQGCKTKPTVTCSLLMLPSPHRSPRKHEGMPKVLNLLNNVSLPFKSVPIDVPTIPAIITATDINSTSNDEVVAITPKIHQFPLLAEELSAGVDVDAVKIKGGEDDVNKDDDEDHFFNLITKDASNNIFFSSAAMTSCINFSNQGQEMQNMRSNSFPRSRFYFRYSLRIHFFA